MEQQNKQTNKHLNKKSSPKGSAEWSNKKNISKKLLLDMQRSMEQQKNISINHLSDRQRSIEQVKSRMTLLLIHLSVADLIVILFQVSLISCYLYFLPSNQIECQKISLLLHLHFPQPNQTDELHEINGAVKNTFFLLKSYST